MKKVAPHFTQLKKSYRQPALNRLGRVKELTKGKLGSSADAIGEPTKYSVD